MRSCVFPGSFDPITCGHLDLIRRASLIYDKVIVTVMINRSKNGIIPYNERVGIIRKACADIPNVCVDLWQGLLCDYMREHNERVVLRGVRNTDEYEKEIIAASMNRRLNPSVETLLIPASAGWSDVSSSAVREIASFGGDIGKLIPECIIEDVKKWLNSVSY